MISKLLREFKKAAGASRESMAESGVMDGCRDCEHREGGSCCGAGLENKYSGILILINFLLGAIIPKERQVPASCFFLGKTGCNLIARHVICVNYLCRKITDHIDRRELVNLREREGVELNILFMLNENIKKALDG